MVAVASGARGSTQVPSHRQGFMVDAGAVALELVGRDGVSLHVGRIGVAAGTGLSDVQGVDLRTCIVCRPQIMNTVAIGADRDFLITFRAQLAVDAGQVLGKLIGA